jgi:type I restriction enzyme, S subunit
MSDLPVGWADSSMADVAELSLGKMLDTKQATGLDPTPYLRNVNVRWGAFDLDDLAAMDIRPDELERVLARRGDVIVCEGGEPGRSAVWSGAPVAIQKALHRVRPRQGVNSSFLAMLLRHQAASGELGRLFTGTTIKHLPKEKLQAVRVPCAPTAEQERIVTAIEEAFAKLDAGEAALRATRQRLKRLRESVLAAAVTGRLVPQDSTDEPASKLLAAGGLKPGEPMVPGELPSSWCWIGLRNISSDSGYGSSVKCDYVTDGPGVLRIPNVQGGSIDLSDLKRAPAIAIPAHLFLKAGDLLIVRTNGSRALIGRAAPVVREQGCSFASYLIRFRIVPSLASVDYLSILLSAPAWRRRLEAAAASSAGQYNLSLRTLDPLPIALPPRQEQDRIVAEVEQQFSFIDACERTVDLGLARSAALRRSILKSAFEGNLVPQDPKDEPAAALLGRTRAERAAVGQAPKPRRTSKATSPA